MVKQLILILSFLTTLLAQPLVNCTSNVLTYLSAYSLGRQHDLNKTFEALKKTVKVPQFTYTPRIGKQYIIDNMTLNFFIINSKQKSEFIGMNQQRIYGAVLKLSYNFAWQKKQLGSSVRGTAQGVVLSDSFDFTKQIGIFKDQPQQFLMESTNTTFSNNFPVSKVTPYSQNDSQTLFVMMNNAVSHEAGKDVIAKAINQHFSEVLNQTIIQDSSELLVPKSVNYSYFDYRGQFKVSFSSPVKQFEMNGDGTKFLLSQVITDDPNFQCGEKITDQPENPEIFGGKQNMLSNTLLKSTVKYALSKGYFNIKLNQDNWQSRAFQFYAGDLYLAIPSLKKNKINPQTVITGECLCANDQTFNFSRKNDQQYQVSMSFSCTIQIILTKAAINVTLRTNDLLFSIFSLTGTPVFQQIAQYKIQNLDYAKFLITQTLKVAKGSHVLGTGYKTHQRQHPYAKVRKDYLFLYDPSYNDHHPQSS